MTYIKLSTESVGDAGDQYTGLDRFGRIVDQRWINSSNTDVDRYQYGYDRDGNRLYKDNKVIASLSEVYTYDSLNQLASYKLGTLNGTKTDVTGSPTTSQSWDYDAVGNWDSITTNSTTQTRTANKQNEITAVSGATTPTYDSNGSLTTDENNFRFVYDAWNKVVQVKNSSNVAIVTYGRDALHRHVTDTVGSTVTDRFFSSDWQLLETKVGSNTVTRNVWSPVYVDGLVLRDRDTDANGTLDERLYAHQDANWNTTALVNSSGTVQERYTYTPFGQVTFRDSSGSTLSSSAKDWVFLHQGGERIAAGDYEFRNRVYSPSLGRWLSSDPLGFEAGDQNWYRAIGNSPGNSLDPSGLQTLGPPITNPNPRPPASLGKPKPIMDPEPVPTSGETRPEGPTMPSFINRPINNPNGDIPINPAGAFPWERPYYSPLEWNIYIQGLYMPLIPINLNPLPTSLFPEIPSNLIGPPNSNFEGPFRVDYGSVSEKPTLTYLDPSGNNPVEAGGSVVYRPNENVTTGLTGYYRPSSGGQISVGGLYENSNPLHPIWAQVKPSFDWKLDTGEGDIKLDWKIGGQSIPVQSRPGGPPVNQYTAPHWYFIIGAGLKYPINQNGMDPSLNGEGSFGIGF
jgi:RHS repeat-associated protein